MNDRRDDEFEGRDADIACAFCGKQPHQVAAMISGPNGKALVTAKENDDGT